MVANYKELYEKFNAKDVKRQVKLLEMDRELGAVYADMEVLAGGAGKYARSTQCVMRRDDFHHANKEAIADLVEGVFCSYKFLLCEAWLAFIPNDKKSVCGCIKMVVVLGGRRFNQHLWTTRLCKMIVNCVVRLRTKYDTAIRKGYLGNNKTLTVKFESCTYFMCSIDLCLTDSHERSKW